MLPENKSEVKVFISNDDLPVIFKAIHSILPFIKGKNCHGRTMETVMSSRLHKQDCQCKRRGDPDINMTFISTVTVHSHTLFLSTKARATLKCPFPYLKCCLDYFKILYVSSCLWSRVLYYEILFLFFFLSFDVIVCFVLLR